MNSKDMAREILDKLRTSYNAKDLAGLAALYDDNITLWSTLGADSIGKDQAIDHIRYLFERLPDEQMTFEVVINDGSTVVVEATSTGMTSAEPYEITFTEVLEIVAGRFTSIKTYIDPVAVPADFRSD